MNEVEQMLGGKDRCDLVLEVAEEIILKTNAEGLDQMATTKLIAFDPRLHNDVERVWCAMKITQTFYMLGSVHGIVVTLDEGT
jgi:hypothetical protein